MFTKLVYVSSDQLWMEVCRQAGCGCLGCALQIGFSA